MKRAYCDQKEIKDIQERIICEEKDKKWCAFVPLEPEIFGHIIVTYLNYDRHKKCIRDISSVDDIDQKILNSLIEGVRIISNKLKNIDNVDRVYVVMTGEDPSAHVHFHLFPRYGFLNNNEIAKWAEKNGLSKGEIDWRRFYANPTKNFKYHHDFSYLGEIQQKYDDWKMNKMNGKPPSKELLIEMKEKLEGILLMGCPICSGSLLSDDFSVIEKQGKRVIIQGNVNAIYMNHDQFKVSPFENFFTVSISPRNGKGVIHLKFRTQDELERCGFSPNMKIRCEGCLHTIDDKEIVFDVTKVEFL